MVDPKVAVKTISFVDEGFNIELVLADSLSGESSQFIEKLAKYNVIVHGVAISVGSKDGAG